MIVEFTGCSGSGKTYFSDQLIQKLKEKGITVLAVHPNHFSLFGPALERLKNESLQHLIMDFTGLPFLLMASAKERSFIHFAWKMLWSYQDSIWAILNRFRNICRMVSTNILLRKRTAGGRIGIVDEGCVHSIHGLFVRPYGSPNLRKLDESIRLVPFPDIIVHVSASLDITVRRTIARPDSPGGRIRLMDKQLIQFIKNGKILYSMFMSMDGIKAKIVNIDSENIYSEDYDRLIREIVANHSAVR